MYSLLAIIIGMVISLMLSLNGMLEGNIGTTYTLITIHIVGLISVTVLMILSKQKIKIRKDIPIYLYLGGIIGISLTLVNIVTINSIGVAFTTGLAVFAQLIFSALIDHFGLFGMDKYPFEKKKLIGFSIIIIGLIVMSI